MRVKKRLLSVVAFFVLSLPAVEAAENDDGFTNFKTIEPERLWFVHSWHYSPPLPPKVTPEEISMTPGYYLGKHKRASRRDGEYLHVLVDSSCEVREGFLFWPYLACGEAPEIRVKSDGFHILETFIKAKDSDKNLLRASHKDIFDALYGNGSAFVEVVNTVESLDKQAVKSYVYRYKLLDFDEK